MGAYNRKDLKAYVRFDGTGRVVPSSLILRRKKPKVGKWVEIPAYECCDPFTPTTTTTSTSTSSTTTTTTTVAPPIERIAGYSIEPMSCAPSPYPSQTVWTSQAINTFVWTNEALTIPFNPFGGIGFQMKITGVIYGVVISPFTGAAVINSVTPCA